MRGFLFWPHMNYLIALVDNKHSATALAFAAATCRSGHTLMRVFFFKDAVTMAASEHPSHKHWQTFARCHNVELIVCSAAAARRNITLTPESAFSIGGLGLYAEAQLCCDKVVHFD